MIAHFIICSTIVFGTYIGNNIIDMLTDGKVERTSNAIFGLAALIAYLTVPK